MSEETPTPAPYVDGETDIDALRGFAHDLLDDLESVYVRVRAESTEQIACLVKLLDQTRAALHVALHYVDDNVTLAPGTPDSVERAKELAGCRIALNDAVGAINAIAAADPAVRPVDAPAEPVGTPTHPGPECLYPVADDWCRLPDKHEGDCSPGAVLYLLTHDDTPEVPNAD